MKAGYLFAFGLVAAATGHNLLLWLLFIAGQCVYILKRAYFSVQGPDREVAGYGAFFKKYAVALIVRCAGGLLIFWLFAFYPDLFTKAVGLLGLSWNLTVPLVPPVAFILGLVSDVALDLVTSRVPWLRGQVPQVGPDTKSLSQGAGK